MERAAAGSVSTAHAPEKACGVCDRPVGTHPGGGRVFYLGSKSRKLGSESEGRGCYASLEGIGETTVGAVCTCCRP